MGTFRHLDHSECRMRIDTRNGNAMCMDFHCPGCGSRVNLQSYQHNCPNCNRLIVEEGIDHGANSPSAD